MNNKEVTIGNEARARLKKGIDKACNAVRPTLGAIGNTAIIEFEGLDPIECDDGVTILKSLKWSDRYENMGLQKLKKAALRTSAEGGDGTATTTVLTQALVEQAFQEVSKDSSKSREVRERLDAGLTELLAELEKQKREVTEEDIERIATISSLDEDVAKLIAEIIKEVGINGVITVEKGPRLGYEKEVVKGARFDKGFISPFFINDYENEQVALEDAYIILVDRKVSTNEQIQPIMSSIPAGSSVLIVADDVDSVALGSLAYNAQNKIYNIACVRNPYNATAGRDFLFDLAALTGATVISEETGMKLENANIELTGKAEKVVVTRDNTTIIGGAGDTSEREAHLAKKIESTLSEYDKKQLEERLASLTGGIGVVRVGAYTDVDFNAKKYKFENAINATQAALQEGIITGGGSALAKCKVTEPMFKNILNAPLDQMAVNAGVTLNTSDHLEGNNGYDFKTKKVVDMFEAGIIDPFKVTRLALESATAIASSLCSIEPAIVTEDTDEQ